MPTLFLQAFNYRSWSSVRVMTSEQRAELLKRISNDEPEKRIPFKDCVKIARDLNLTLEQVSLIVCIAPGSYNKCYKSTFLHDFYVENQCFLILNLLRVICALI